MLHPAIDRYRAAYSGLPRDVWLLAIVFFVNRSGSMVLPFMTLYLTSQLKMSDAAAGWLISAYGLGAVTGAYLGGRITERVGAFRVQTVCMFLSAPGYLTLPLWSDWKAIAANLFVLSLVTDGVRPANATAITRLSTPENRARAFALQRMALNLGMSVGPALGGFLATIHFGLLFVVDAVTSLLAAVALLFFFRMRRQEAPIAEPRTVVEHGSPLADRVFVAYLALILATLMVFFQFGSTYPLYLHDHFGFSKPLIGLTFTINTLGIVALEMLLVDAAREWRLTRTIGCGACLACIGFGMLPFGSSGAYCVLSMLVLTLGEMLTFPLSASFVGNRAPRGAESLYMGWYTVVVSAAQVLGPALGSVIYQANHDALWYTGLGIGVAVFVGFQVLAMAPGVDARVADP